MANERYYTLSSLRTKVRNQLDEASPSFWSEDQLTEYINRAYSRVWNRLKALNEQYCAISRTSQDGSTTILGETYATSSFAIVAGTSDYSLPPDFASLSAIECLTSGYEDLTFTSSQLSHPNFRAARSVVGNVAAVDELLFVIFGEPAKMRIAPKTDVALDLRLTYIPILADLSADADPMFLPRPAHLAVIDYATALALRQDRSPDAGTFESAGDKLIAEEFGADSRQTQDVQTARGYLED